MTDFSMRGAGPFSEGERRLYFEALVLQMLWLIIRMMVIQRSDVAAAGDVRAKAIIYLDIEGNQSPSAPDYRREKSFPALPF